VGIAQLYDAWFNAEQSLFYVTWHESEYKYQMNQFEAESLLDDLWRNNEIDLRNKIGEFDNEEEQ